MPTQIQRSRVKPATDATAEKPDPTAKPLKGRVGPDGKPAPVPLAEMLSLTEVDMRVIELRVGLVRAVRQIRKDAGLTQAEVAKRLEVSRTRIAEMESNGHIPTFDSLIPAFFAVGGTVDQFCAIMRQTDGCMER